MHLLHANNNNFQPICGFVLVGLTNKKIKDTDDNNNILAFVSYNCRL